MGMITVKLEGSFNQFDTDLQCQALFMAIEHGHEYAVRDAIHFLENTVLPSAIENDEKCAAENVFPREGLKKYEVPELPQQLNRRIDYEHEFQ